jgi:hypothetical protein
MSERDMLHLLLGSVDKILDRITLSHLSRYETLQRELCATNVAADPNYQRTLRGYYKMQRRRRDWYAYFFSLLEREKNNRNITFGEVLAETHSSTGRIEPSFSSTLVATIRPEKPVYDQHVWANLLLAVPGYYKAPHIRVQEFIAAYSSLESRVAALVQSVLFVRELRPAFDTRFPAYVHFTDVKKLDLLLWQHRTGSGVA